MTPPILCPPPPPLEDMYKIMSSMDDFKQGEEVSSVSSNIDINDRKQARQIQNRLSAIRHRERKKAEVESLKCELSQAIQSKNIAEQQLDAMHELVKSLQQQVDDYKRICDEQETVISQLRGQTTIVPNEGFEDEWIHLPFDDEEVSNSLNTLFASEIPNVVTGNKHELSDTDADDDNISTTTPTLSPQYLDIDNEENIAKRRRVQSETRGYRTIAVLAAFAFTFSLFGSSDTSSELMKIRDASNPLTLPSLPADWNVEHNDYPMVPRFANAEYYDDDDIDESEINTQLIEQDGSSNSLALYSSRARDYQEMKNALMENMVKAYMNDIDALHRGEAPPSDATIMCPRSVGVFWKESPRYNGKEYSYFDESSKQPFNLTKEMKDSLLTFLLPTSTFSEYQDVHSFLQLQCRVESVFEHGNRV